MRMNPAKGEPASALLARITEADLEAMLVENADEPQAALIARLLVSTPVKTTHALQNLLRNGLTEALPRLPKPDIKLSIRRTFQALRIAVNDEFAVLDALLRALPHCLRPGGRAAIITFHSGEDRRVKKSFQAGRRSGLYADVADEVIRAGKEETFSNRRASSAKLRWAVKASVDAA
jgi:16S rRNA (cytosine1402-N4)-methyltransferase